MKWNWQLGDWPNFSFNVEKIESLEREFLHKSGEISGIIKHIDCSDQESFRIDLLSEEALKTSKIEGEILDRDSLQSSIKKHFGLKVDRPKLPAAEQGIAMMSVDLYTNFATPLSHEKLYQWHRMLMNGRVDVRDVGCYRADKEPMQVVSNRLNKSYIHYEAPPCDILKSEMNYFIEWFNKADAMPALARAAIAHWHFVCIHPFEDGNGRIARALSEYALAQNLKQPSLIALAYTIEKKRKEYYEKLEQHNHSNDITDWVYYFANIIIEAQNNTQKRIEFLIAKSKLMGRLGGQLNSRQEKVLIRMFKEGVDGFSGGLSAKKYINISGTTTATASRDLLDLVKKNALKKEGKLKHTRYYLDI